METIKSENKNQKEEINEEEPSLIKYIINKNKMFKLIGNNSNKKFSRDYQQINKRGGRIKNFFLKCFRNNCRKDDLIITVVVIISIICYHFGLTKCEKDPSECTIKRGMIFYFTIGILSAISAVLYAVFITLSIYKRKYFIHYL